VKIGREAVDHRVRVAADDVHPDLHRLELVVDVVKQSVQIVILRTRLFLVLLRLLLVGLACRAGVPLSGTATALWRTRSLRSPGT
jgi:hypothetical protein